MLAPGLLKRPLLRRYPESIDQPRRGLLGYWWLLLLYGQTHAHAFLFLDLWAAVQLSSLTGWGYLSSEGPQGLRGQKHWSAHRKVTLVTLWLTEDREVEPFASPTSGQG